MIKFVSYLVQVPKSEFSNWKKNLEFAFKWDHSDYLEELEETEKQIKNLNKDDFLELYIKVFFIINYLHSSESFAYIRSLKNPINLKKIWI